ncbi:MAG: hypothetical protein GF393_03960 [Armatimonadia bacterium]|nr:hypothetical protein [Armatimonadia bacterium]
MSMCHRTVLLFAAAVMISMLAGCGGGGNSGTAPPPDAPQVETGEVTIGPFVMQPAAATNVQIQSLASGQYGASFAVFNGVTIDYVGVREMLDRVVFSSSRGGGWQLHTCDFFGESLTKITNNGNSNGTPAWSPDGSRLAWTFYSATLKGEILVRPAGGGAATHLTNHSADDEHPTWSPDGRWIAFQSDRTGDDRIFKMTEDGSAPIQLTNAGPGLRDIHPDWRPPERDEMSLSLAVSPSAESRPALILSKPEILFASNRLGSYTIYGVAADGSNEGSLVTSSASDDAPAWHPFEDEMVYRRSAGGTLGYEIYANNLQDSEEHLVATGASVESQPCYSQDGKYLFFVSNREGGNNSIWAKQTSFPYRLHRVTDSGGPDKEPDLGNPRAQISRVLVGPAGSDHGYDPIHDSAVAGIVAFGFDGYLNFVRLGIPPASGSSLTATPLDTGGIQLAGVVLSAPNMYYIEEDAGIGVPPKMWDFTGATSRTALVYMNAVNGKVVSVVDMGDTVHTTAADAVPGISQEFSGSSVIASGDFKRVWNADAELVAEGDIGAVEIDAARGVVRAF